MKFYISAICDFVIDVPEITREEWGKGKTEKISKIFWDKYDHGYLPKPTIWDIDSIEEVES